MTTTREEPVVIVDGQRFPEGSRWHDGALWWSDMHTGQVFRLAEGSREPEEVLALEGDQSSGLGWLPDGSLLVSAMLERKVWRQWPDGRLSVHADLSGLTPYPVNDMLVDASGCAYLGSFGFDLYGGASRSEANLYLIQPSGQVTVAAGQMRFPNGTVIIPGSRTLVVGESFGRELTAFDIAGDGQLSARRVWAGLPEGTGPDGICVDTAGGIWVASPGSSEFFRVERGGRVTAGLKVPGRLAVDCVLGGASGTTLYLLTSNSSAPAQTVDARAGRIETVTVDIPGPVS